MTISLVAIGPSDPNAIKLRGLAGVVMLENIATTQDFKVDESTTIAFDRNGKKILLAGPDAKSLNEKVNTADFVRFSARELFELLQPPGDIKVTVNEKAYDVDPTWREQVDDVIDQLGIRLTQNGYRWR